MTSDPTMSANTMKASTATTAHRNVVSEIETIARRATAKAWCPEADTRGDVVGRRDALAGLWAGRLMHLSDDTLSVYAAEVHVCGSLSDDADEVVHKLWYDLNRAGLPTTRETIREKLHELRTRAVDELSLAGRARAI